MITCRIHSICIVQLCHMDRRSSSTEHIDPLIYMQRRSPCANQTFQGLVTINEGCAMRTNFAVKGETEGASELVELRILTRPSDQRRV